MCARQRVHEAEQRVFSSGEKRAFDTALQEMLNQATIEVKVSNVQYASCTDFLILFCGSAGRRKKLHAMDMYVYVLSSTSNTGNS